MIGRLLTGASLLFLGYYIGREVGRTEPIRRELREARDADNKEPEKPSPMLGQKTASKPARKSPQKPVMPGDK